MKEKIIVNFIWKPKKTEITYYYKDCFFDIFKNFWVKTYFLFQGENTDFLLELNEKYNIFWIYFDNFTSFEELILKTEKFEIIEATTLTEWIIPILHEFKEKLGKQISKEKELFRNKNIQRELLLKYDKNISINYKKIDSISDISLDEIKLEFDFPFIIKPVSWIQSQLVFKVENEVHFKEVKNAIINANKEHLNRLNNWNDTGLLIEEYIDWEMYSIDYYVDENQNIFISKAVKVFLWPELWVDDFMNYNRISGDAIENELQNYDLDWFIKKNVLATDIRWTFIHHEFKLNTKWQLKTIELNWRIWGFRLEMILESYWFNMFRFFFWEKLIKENWINNSVFLIYSKERWILKWFNYDLIEKVKNLKSFLNINIFDELIWKEVWLTKDWFPKSMLIKLKNIDNKQFSEDIKFLKDNYFDFLILE